MPTSSHESQRTPASRRTAEPVASESHTALHQPPIDHSAQCRQSSDRGCAMFGRPRNGSENRCGISTAGCAATSNRRVRPRPRHPAAECLAPCTIGDADSRTYRGRSRTTFVDRLWLASPVPSTNDARPNSAGAAALQASRVTHQSGIHRCACVRVVIWPSSIRGLASHHERPAIFSAAYKAIFGEFSALSGKAFYFGNNAPPVQTTLYVLEANPAGEPGSSEEQTVAAHTNWVATAARPDLPAYREERCRGRRPCQYGMQPRLAHAFRVLGLNAGTVSASNFCVHPVKSCGRPSPKLPTLRRPWLASLQRYRRKPAPAGHRVPLENSN